jgi:rhamnogalacturonyl hydrolase YesR
MTYLKFASLKKNLLFVLFILLIAYSNQSTAQSAVTADSTLKIMKKVADWQFKSWERKGMQWPKSDWTNGAAYTGFMALNKIANNPKYINKMYQIGDDLDWKTGPNRTHADQYCVGQMFSEMYSLYHQPKMIADFIELADSIIGMPHTESLEWRNGISNREWAWCDALYMGPPALAYLSTAAGEIKYLDIASKLWWKTTDYLFDSSENLYYRDSRYFNKKEANGKKVFWSRGNGWVMGGIVRMLENMPQNYKDRSRFISLFKRMADKIATLQSEDGSWHASLLDAESYPVKETSGTGFYCYALAWGVDHGLLSYQKFNPVIEKAWAALTSSVHYNGMLGYVQEIGAQPASVDSNSTEVYGIGAFLLAGSEVINVLLKHSENPNILTLSNQTGLARNEEVVEVPFSNFNSKIKSAANSPFKLTNALTGEEIPYQLEYRGNKKPFNVLIEISLSPGSQILSQVSHEKPADFAAKTYARFVPERYDDLAWENDRIAFRVYGKALERVPNEMAYGLDVWAKKTSKLVINDWYKKADYHVDHGEGLDFYDVGLSLGAGSSAPYIKDSIFYSKNYRKYKILDNGPLRSTFQLFYDNWNVDGKTVGESEIISLDAGSQLNKIETVYSFKDKKMPVAVGIVEHSGDGTFLLDERKGIMGYWQPENKKNGILGIGCIIPQDNLKMKLDKQHLLTYFEVSANKPMVYYAGAGWDKAGIISDSKMWFQYLENFKTKLDHPILIKWL